MFDVFGAFPTNSFGAVELAKRRETAKEPNACLSKHLPHFETLR
jgi:hypothetical protein